MKVNVNFVAQGEEMTQPLHIDNSFNAAASCDTRANAPATSMAGRVRTTTSRSQPARRFDPRLSRNLLQDRRSEAALKAFRADYEEWAAANVPDRRLAVKYAAGNIRRHLEDVDEAPSRSRRALQGLSRPRGSGLLLHPRRARANLWNTAATMRSRRGEGEQPATCSTISPTGRSRRLGA